MSETSALLGITLASTTSNHTSIAIASVFLVLSWVAVSLRVYTRALLIRSFSWDDWFIVIALATYTLQCSATIYVSWIEIGPGLTDIKWISRIVMVLISLSALYAVTSTFLKLSLACFFLRIVINKGQLWLIRVSVGIFAVVAAAFFFIFLFQCGDPSKVLERQLEGRCIARTVLTDMLYLHGALSAATDWMFAILPIFVLYHAKMARKTKICACLLLAIGAVGSIASLVRLAYISSIDTSTGNTFRAYVKPSILSNVECGLGIVACSLATFRPLVKRWDEKRRTGWSWSSKSRSKHGSIGEVGGSWVQLEVTVSSEKRQAGPVSYGHAGGSRDVGNSTYVITEPEPFPPGMGSTSNDTMPLETRSFHSRSPALVSASRRARPVTHENGTLLRVDTDDDLGAPQKEGFDAV